VQYLDEHELFTNDIVKKILEKTRVIWALNHASSLMDWDLRVNMPKDGFIERSIARSEISALMRVLTLDEKLIRLVERAEDEIDELNDYERGLIRVLKRKIRIAKALPLELVREYNRIVSEAGIRWEEAKDRDNYDLFKPYLNRIVELSRRIADCLGYEEHPYDALLDLKDEGFRTRDMDGIFDVLEPEIRDMLDEIMSQGYYPAKHELEEVKYDVKVMDELNREILKVLGYPLGSRGRLDVSAHPFTSGIGIRDARITTRYEGHDFQSSLFAVIHEFGHALYTLQIDKRLMTTPLAMGVSSGVHESQSRFWENIIGRSKVFVKAVYPILARHLKFIKEYSPEDIYLYFNTVRPSLIRVDADEVTYNLHILLRFKLEKLMVAGEVNVDDLPELWNDEMERLFGIRPKTYRDGLLQDIHWSIELAGFPAYTIGNVIAAQIKHHIEREFEGFYECISELDLKPIREYLREKVHRWGSTYPPKELIRRSFGEEIDPSYFLGYIREKYLR